VDYTCSICGKFVPANGTNHAHYTKKAYQKKSWNKTLKLTS
jgi:hypothetical protein